jgi:hypothetical protein
MTFILTTNSDLSYDKIMEKLTSKGIYFSKNSNGGTISLEINGSVQDYREFKDMIESGTISAFLQETI